MMSYLIITNVYRHFRPSVVRLFIAGSWTDEDWQGKREEEEGGCTAAYVLYMLLTQRGSIFDCIITKDRQVSVYMGLHIVKCQVSPQQSLL